MSVAESPLVPARERIQKIAFVLLVTFVTLAPFPYGAVLPKGILILEIFAFTIAILAIATRTAEQRLGAGVIPAMAIAAIALIGAVQVVPMSLERLRSVSPVSAKAYVDANEVLRLFGQSPVRPRISIAPTDTVNTILLALAYCALLIASMILANTRSRRRWLMAALLSTAVIHIVIATITSTSDRLHGTFVNADHMAGYLEIALAFAFGLVWSEVLTGAERSTKLPDRGERFERRLIAVVWRVLVWAVIAAGIVLTRSRGGLLAAACTTAILLIMAVLHGRSGSVDRGRNRAVIAGALAVGVLIVILTTGQSAVLRFLSSDPRDIGSDTRVEIWRGSVRAWHLFPNSGSGLGTFREAFRRVQSADLVGLVEQAHNDFLQLLVTAGWPGAGLGALAFASMFFLLLGGWMRQRHREERAFILAGFGALLCLTLHGLVEFNMSIAAIPATLAVMVGSAWSATHA